MDPHLIVLLHLVPWDDNARESVTIASGIEYSRLKGTLVEGLYYRLCEEQNVDQGEPYDFTTYFDIDSKQHCDGVGGFQSPYSIVSRLCNMIAICSDHPIGMARIICCDNNYEKASDTNIVYDYTQQSEQIEWFSPSIEQPVTPYLNLLGKYWYNQDIIFAQYSHSGRIANALVNFFYTWQAYHIEQACINMSVIMESLFGPPSTTELAHQIAYNACRFFGNTKDERQKTYKLIKQFYRVRSQLIHGDQPSNESVRIAMEQMYPLCTSVLRQLLTDKAPFEKFNNIEERQKIFDDWLFD